MSADKQFVIYGCGSLGREVLNYSGRRGHREPPPRERVMWLDDGRNEDERIDGVEVGRFADISENAHIVVALADPATRARISARMFDTGRKLASVRFPPSSGYCINGAHDSIVMPFTLISCNARAGRGLVMNTFSSLGHDVILGRYCTLSSYVCLAGGCTTGDNVFFGTGAKVAPGVEIGANAYIGAGAIVLQDVPAGAQMFGNPARRIG